MTREQHAKIFSAYLNRLKISGLELINEAQTEAWRDCQNHGMSAQIKSQQRADEITQFVINGMLQHDLDIIERVIKEAQ